MGKFIISEEEKKHIMGLYEQSTTTTTSGTTEEPDFRHIKTAKRTISGVKEVVPTEKDYEDYRRGFNNAINKIKPKTMPIPSNEIRGAREAKERGLIKK
jgi:soluble cytochrome b562